MARAVPRPARRRARRLRGRAEGQLRPGTSGRWRDRHISSYASSHRWEDWAETWAHYLHIVDGLDTALGFGLSAIDLDTTVERFRRDDLYAPDDAQTDRFVFFLDAWFELAYVLNELSRSMGQPDFYPFVVSRPVARKLHFVHLVIRELHLAIRESRGV
ncbi:MAG: putative zinc-binding metallopeptidase [Betaproteobacteria bacterium]